MYLKIGTDSALSMEEVDDFKRFHISAEMDTMAGDEALDAFKAIADDAGDDHFWLSVDTIIALSGCAEDEKWMAAFSDMLEKAAPYGFADLDGHRIKAHVM